ncbi:MAG: tRNA lysidine(34) synthetase TilS [Betaproteobacteria bacterium HGW-Betaproteobacteria-22]|nr:MAG: tRNA lysidine(34) synthetase TilS [Betaproteobacteria bacterium HGW-Betaproteobacteria-22]
MENSKKLLKDSTSKRRADIQAKYSKPSITSLDALNTHPLVAKLNTFFLARNFSKSTELLLALSGGLDSMVLLHLLSQVKRNLGFELRAMHVHHGLSPNADAWAELCKRQCALYGVPLKTVYVKVNQASKLGVEAAARQLRYQALFADQSGADRFVVMAHHQDDQAETLLLQLMRGSGVKGLSAMAVVDSTRHLLRPLLNVSRHALADYAVQHGLIWCDDESNRDVHFERNFLRHEIMPVLASRYPAVQSTLARTAAHLAEANDLLDVLAKQDAENLLADNSLCLKGLAVLDFVRSKNLLRWWLGLNQLAMPSTEHLSEIIQQLLHAKSDADLMIRLQDKTIRRYQNRAYIGVDKIPLPFDLVWQGEPCLDIPNGGKLNFVAVEGRGLSHKYVMHQLRVTHRTGGERFKPHAAKPTRTLKYLLQEINMPPWQRTHLPLIYWGDTLAYVPGVGAACDLAASASEQGYEVFWQYDAFSV